MNTANTVKRFIELLSHYTEEKISQYQKALKEWVPGQALPPLGLLGGKLHNIFPLRVTALISEIYYPPIETIMYANGNKYRVRLKPANDMEKGADIIMIEGKPYQVIERVKLNKITVTDEVNKQVINHKKTTKK